MHAADRLPNTQVVQRLTLIFFNLRRELNFQVRLIISSLRAACTQGTQHGSAVGSRDPGQADRLSHVHSGQSVLGKGGHTSQSSG